MSWSTSELRVRLAPLNRFKPSSKIFYWPFQGGTSFVDLLCFCSVLCLLCLCACLFICAFAFVVTCWERADLLALVCGVCCEFVTFPLVSWVRCGTWLYRFLIFAPLLTLMLLPKNGVPFEGLYYSNYRSRFNIYEDICNARPIKYHTWLGNLYGKVTKTQRTREPRSQSFPSVHKAARNRVDSITKMNMKHQYKRIHKISTAMEWSANRHA